MQHCNFPITKEKTRKRLILRSEYIRERVYQFPVTVLIETLDSSMQHEKKRTHRRRINWKSTTVFDKSDLYKVWQFPTPPMTPPVAQIEPESLENYFQRTIRQFPRDTMTHREQINIVSSTNTLFLFPRCSNFRRRPQHSFQFLWIHWQKNLAEELL